MANKFIVFGDIHGCYKALETAIEIAKEEQAIAVFLGDYVDRGPNSLKTLEILIKAKKDNPDWIFLRGNHDQMLLDLINREINEDTEFEVYAGKTSNLETSKVYNQYKKLSIEKKDEINIFLISTKFYHETNNWIFVHAPLINNGILLKNKTTQELIWNYNLTPTWEGKLFIHGHLTTTKIQKNNNGININTNCGYGGFLTGLVVEDKQLIFGDIDLTKKLRYYSILENGLKLN
jgi:serine/threonine protein phosphatase 1